MFRNFINTFVNCFKIPELKSRILFTLGLLAVAQVLGYVRLPGIDGNVLASNLTKSQGPGGMLGLYNTFAGGAADRCAVSALSIIYSLIFSGATIIHSSCFLAVWLRFEQAKGAIISNRMSHKIVQYAGALP